ncbi:TSUP family transporter [Litorivicinus lipolyticus]|uniref:Probable membrane transporter protein n=1 Tax=Litorivicinus lipolyticus TaxID=418701 RepID=A0A5Q2QC49_9GAMM|nr:sulfite exporter TauE/SafE family protein [Litorivicinus lipolyticus]QGG79410.1 TSUP family transporter [Litorivicinus lipolyticus]
MAALEIHWIGLLLAIFVGSYVQTLSGFALGMLVMGFATGFGLAPIAFTAMLVSASAFLNSALGLQRHWRQIPWRSALWLLALQSPMMVAGVYALNVLSGDSVAWLEILMGTIFMLTAATSVMTPPRNARTSGPGVMALTGALSGFLGGLFSTGGPPLVFTLYRQPWSLPVVRACLFLMFSVSSIVRLAVVGVNGDWSVELGYAIAIALPAIAAGAFAARRWSPALSDTNFRRAAYALLSALGLWLVVSGIGLLRAI